MDIMAGDAMLLAPRHPKHNVSIEENVMPNTKAIMPGVKFGRLTFLELTRVERHKWGRFLCQCGVYKECRMDHVLSGRIVSCGCRKKLDPSSRTHGQSKTRLYGAWAAMIARCYNQNVRCYARYGGRGIQVCERWRTSFEAFAADMGKRPTGMTLDRKNNDGNYEPSNCRWATNTEQSRNRRNNVIIEWNGKRQLLTLWADETGLNYGTLQSRLKRGEIPPRLFRAIGTDRLPRPKIGHYRKRSPCMQQ